ncbi:MAG: NADP-dependent malic enzyme [Acholeplasmataceae bacterium]|jgi:malate dehydrogenase (oxaloacetate-decarboxylating)|nr:NADP-dependent malic enzyme [Acholeplasmataceae bacterium]
MDLKKESIKLHREAKGKIAVKSKVPLKNMTDMALAYTPGVAAACLAIAENPEEAYSLTAKQNTVAVVSDGSAVLGLGNIGPLAAIPVMEGKCAIFKEFAGVDAIPIVLNATTVDEIVAAVKMIAPSFGGINLEDISAPKCFLVEKRLKELLDIPVFHDDQHGTAVVVGAALINALKIVKKDLAKISVVINGAGSAGVAITKFLLDLGVKDLVVCDKKGILSYTDDNLNFAKKELIELTNKTKKTGLLVDALKDADVFIGVSAGNIVDRTMIKKMNDDAIVFALANPVPEIHPDEAFAGGARIVGTGLSNLPNQINNSLAFPGLFKGILEARAKQFTKPMLVAASYALANLVTAEQLNEQNIIPHIFDEAVSRVVSEAVIKVAREEL